MLQKPRSPTAIKQEEEEEEEVAPGAFKQQKVPQSSYVLSSKENFRFYFQAGYGKDRVAVLSFLSASPMVSGRPRFCF